MWPSLKSSTSGQNMSEEEDGDMVQEIADSSQSESAMAIAQSEQFLAGLKLGMAASRIVGKEKPPGGGRRKAGGGVDEGVQTDNEPGGLGQNHSTSTSGQERDNGRGSKQNSFSREGGNGDSEMDADSREDSEGGARESGEGADLDGAQGRRAWNPFRRPGDLRRDRDKASRREPEEALPEMERRVSNRNGAQDTAETSPVVMADDEMDQVNQADNSSDDFDAHSVQLAESNPDRGGGLEDSPGVDEVDAVQEGSPDAGSEETSGVIPVEASGSLDRNQSLRQVRSDVAGGETAAQEDSETTAVEAPAVSSENEVQPADVEIERQSSSMALQDARSGEEPEAASQNGTSLTGEEAGTLEKHDDGLVSPSLQSRRATRKSLEGANPALAPRSLERLGSKGLRAHLTVPESLDLNLLALSPKASLDNEKSDLSIAWGGVSPTLRSPDLLIGGKTFGDLKRSSLSETLQRRREKAERRKTHGEVLRLAGGLHELFPAERYERKGGPESPGYMPSRIDSLMQDNAFSSGGSREPSPLKESDGRSAAEWKEADDTWRAEVKRLQEENARVKGEADEKERMRQYALEEVAALRAELDRMRAQGGAATEPAQVPLGEGIDRPARSWTLRQIGVYETLVNRTQNRGPDLQSCLQRGMRSQVTRCTSESGLSFQVSPSKTVALL
jgi:hypothetical protein